MPHWTSDDELGAAAADLKSTFVWLLEDEWPASGYPGDQIAGINSNVDTFTSLDPQKLSDEYNRMYAAATAIGENLDAVAELRQSVRYLNNWTGAAADAFKMQLDKVEKFCDEQQTRILRVLQGLAAMYALAVESRVNFHGLLLAAKAAAINEKKHGQQADNKMKVALLFDVVTGIVGRDPKSLLGSTLESLLEMGKDTADRMIEGNDPEQVMASYAIEASRQCEDLKNCLSGLADGFLDQTLDAQKPSGLSAPLATICDVSSPDFRYENFKDNVHSPGSIESTVDEERKKYLAEKEQENKRNSDIDRRLNHGRGAA